MYSWSDGHRVPATVAGNKYSYEQIFCPALRCDWLRVVQVFFLPMCSLKEQTCRSCKQCWSFILNTKLKIKTKRLYHSDRSNVHDIVRSLYHTFTQTSGLVVMNNWQSCGCVVQCTVCECAVCTLQYVSVLCSALLHVKPSS